MTLLHLWPFQNHKYVHVNLSVTVGVLMGCEWLGKRGGGLNSRDLPTSSRCPEIMS